MYLYIILLLLCIIPLFNGVRSFTLYNKFIWYFLVPFIVCFGYMTGTDWVNYEKEWDLINLNYYNPFVDGYEEPGYWVLCYIFKSLGIGFWEFNILLKLFGYFVFIKVYRHFCGDTTWGLLYGLVFWMFNSLINFPARNFCAWIIYIWAIQYIEERKLVRYILACALALCFHVSIIMVIPIYFLRIHMTQKQLYRTVGIIIIFVIVLNQFNNFLWQISQSVELLGIADRTEGYASGNYRHQELVERTSFSFGFVARTLIYVLAIKYRNDIFKKYKYGDFILNMSFFVVVYDAIVTVVPLLARGYSAVVITYCVLFAYLMNVVKIDKVIVNTVAFIFLLSFTIGTVKNYIYVPYSNYLEYALIKGTLPYTTRVGYNLRNCPYNN